MFETNEGRLLYEVLKSAIPAATCDNHALLRAYFTCLLAHQKADSGFHVDLKDTELQLHIFPELLDNKYADLRRRILSVPILDYLRFFCPIENISGRQEFKNIENIKTKFHFRSELDFVATILLNKVPIVDYKKVIYSKDTRKNLFGDYTEMTKRFRMTRVEPKEYYELLYVIYGFMLEETKQQYIKEDLKDQKGVIGSVNELVRILFDITRLNRDSVADALLALFDNCINFTDYEDVLFFLLSEGAPLLWVNDKYSETQRVGGENEEEKNENTYALYKQIASLFLKTKNSALYFSISMQSSKSL